MRRFLILSALLWSASAAADLYRWVDPETGSVKYSSYPPPWYGDEAQRRAPKVEHIPASRGAVPPPMMDSGGAQDGGAVPPGRNNLTALEQERKAMLQQIAAGIGRGTSGQAMQKQLEAFAALSDRLDKLNPEGAAARRTEAEDLLQKLIKGEKR